MSAGRPAELALHTPQASGPGPPFPNPETGPFPGLEFLCKSYIKQQQNQSIKPRVAK